MAKPDFQTRPGHAAGTKGQSPQPDREAPGRPPDLSGAGENASSEGSNEPADDATNPAAWGLDTKTGGLSPEAKVGLALVAVLLCAFTLVVYKRIDQARSQQPSEETKQVASDDDATDPPPDSPEKPTLRPADDDQPAPVAMDDSPTFGARQHEPAPQRATSDDPFAALALDDRPPPAPPVEEAAPGAAEPEVSADHPLASAVQTEPPTAMSQSEDPFALGAPAQQPEPAVSDVQLVADQSEPSAQGAMSPEVFDLFPADPAPAAEPAAPTVAGETNTATAAQPAADDLLDPFAPIDTPNKSREPGQTAEPDLARSEPSQPQQLPDDVAGELLAPGPSLGEAPMDEVSLDDPLTAETPADAGRTAAGSTTIVLAPGAGIPQPAEPPQPVDLGFEEPTSDPFGELPSSQTETRSPEPANDLFPQPSPASNDSAHTPSESSGTYTVRPGDSFWLISRRQYGTARYYMALARYNSERIADPALMRPGMKILVPDRETLEAACPDLFPPRSTQPGNIAGAQPAGFALDPSGRPIYRTSAEDTLSSIAERHLGRSSRWIQIYEMNRTALASPDDLKVGTTLRLPADATPARQ